MGDAPLTLLSTVIGGLLAMAGSALIEHRNTRVQRRERWERDRLESIVDLCVAAQDFEGSQYRRGRALRSGTDEQVDARSEAAAAAGSRLWAAAVRAELLLPEAAAGIANLTTRARTLRDDADRGLESRDRDWIAHRDAHQEAIRILQTLAQQTLGLGSSSS